jgi:hypothetical protein
MSTSKTTRWRRVPIQFAVVAAVATGAAGAIAGAATANDEDDRASEAPAAAAAVEPDPNEAVPVWIAVREQLRLRQIAAKMPSGWPATEAMQRAAEHPLGDAVARERWTRDAERMPSGWPATEAMQRAAAKDDG